jgi:hypothetical protein
MDSADRIRLAIITGWTLVWFGLGWGACHLYERPHEVAVTAHAQRDLGHGAIEAARIPEPPKPAQPVPAGAKPVSSFTATVAPTAPVKRKDVQLADQPAPPATSGPLVTTAAELKRCAGIMECPAVTVDGTVVQNRDGTTDLLLSANGQPIDGTYRTGAVIAVPAQHPWAAGLVYSNQGWGGFVDRDLGPLRLGVEAGQGYEAIHLGGRF